jgi:hypothetical protein
MLAQRLMVGSIFVTLCACGSAPTGGIRGDVRLMPNDAGQRRDAAVPIDDAGEPPRDSGVAATDSGVIPARDGGVADGVDPAAGQQIATIRSAEAGAINVVVSTVMVTATRPEHGLDVAGFFVQANRSGPAIFVAHNPAANGIQAGTLLSFTATECADSYGQRIVTSLSDLLLRGEGDALDMLQDVNAADDLESALGDYEAEYLDADVTLTGGMGFAGNSFAGAPVNTTGMLGTGLVLRLPDTLQMRLQLVEGCSLTIKGPMWRYRVTPQLSAYSGDALSNIECPATALTEALAMSSSEVRLSFSRALDVESLSADGSQFTIAGLAISAAVVSDDTTITLTTARQGSGESYSVSVDDSLLDAAGAALGEQMRSADFEGFLLGVQLSISELNANITNGCDLLELQAIGGGSIEGFTIKERRSTVLTLPAISVADGDIILVHFNGGRDTCNPGSASDETQSITQFGGDAHSRNYATAWDLWSTDSGITATDNVLQVLDADGIIQDALLVADAPTGTAAADSERAAAAVAEAGQWTQQDGALPAGGFIDDDFCANAVQGLGDENRDGSNSIQRNHGEDRNHAGDWSQTLQDSSWGLANR